MMDRKMDGVIDVPESLETWKSALTCREKGCRSIGSSFLWLPVLMDWMTGRFVAGDY